MRVIVGRAKLRRVDSAGARTGARQRNRFEPEPNFRSTCCGGHLASDSGAASGEMVACAVPVVMQCTFRVLSIRLCICFVNTLSPSQKDESPCSPAADSRISLLWLVHSQTCEA